MRIIIETDEEAETETFKTGVREESVSTKAAREEATDAGGAPSTGPTRPEDTTTHRAAPKQTPRDSEQTVDGGAAPRSLTASMTKEKKDVTATGQVTDAGGAPVTRPAARDGPSTKEGVSPGGRSPRRAPERTFTEKTDAGRPSVPTNGSSIPATAEQTAMDYEAIVSGTVEEVKERVKGGHLDISKLIEAEQSGDDRNTLIDWLERQKP
ncbi:hypothetical protein ACH9L7_01505 [Haloferax sp. S1W]|uniref:hypothetical protein n=1 Tax=Haloferax sp. S1W TaxID=3377110 RepID=UPI0037CC480B